MRAVWEFAERPFSDTPSPPATAPMSTSEPVPDGTGADYGSTKNQVNRNAGAPDGKRFLMIKQAEAQAAQPDELHPS